MPWSSSLVSESASSTLEAGVEYVWLDALETAAVPLELELLRLSVASDAAFKRLPNAPMTGAPSFGRPGWCSGGEELSRRDLKLLSNVNPDFECSGREAV